MISNLKPVSNPESISIRLNNMIYISEAYLDKAITLAQRQVLKVINDKRRDRINKNVESIVKTIKRAVRSLEQLDKRKYRAKALNITEKLVKLRSLKSKLIKQRDSIKP